MHGDAETHTGSSGAASLLGGEFPINVIQQSLAFLRVSVGNYEANDFDTSRVAPVRNRQPGRRSRLRQGLSGSAWHSPRISDNR